jgi:hypothetical protein
MAFDTPSLFDSMEHDTTMQRVASRRALALAHKRVDVHLGAFFRGAQSEEEFLERLALVQDDFAGYVLSSAEEVGHENPEHIAAALKDHYRLAATPKFIDPKIEEEEDPEGEEEDPKTSSLVTSAWKIEAVGGDFLPPEQADPSQLGREHPAPVVPYQDQQGYAGQMPAMDPHAPQQRVMGPPNPNDPTMTEGGAADQGFGMNPQQYAQWEQQDPYRQQFQGGVNVNPDQMIQPGQLQNPAVMPANDPTQMPQSPAQGAQQPSPGMPQQMQPPTQMGQPMPGQPGTVDPTQVDPNNPYNNIVASTLTCPVCGGTKKQANEEPCTHCAGVGKVENFGNSVVDEVGADIKTSSWSIVAESPAGFGGPEPVINKEHREPPEPKPGDDRHPTKHMDILEPTPYRNRDEGNDLNDIGEGHSKTVDLPAATGDDSGFSTETPGGMAPHTKTFPKGDQANPVTNETISSANPLTRMLANDDFPSDAVVQAALARR